MTIKTTGSLGINADINAEFGLGTDLNNYKGVTWWKDDGSTGTFSTSVLNMDQFHGKRKYGFVYYRNAQSVYTVGNETVIIFSTTGSAGLIRPSVGTSLRALIVGGGGKAGAASRAGGGGSGGAIDFSGLNLTNGTDYTISVGEGSQGVDAYGHQIGGSRTSSIGSVLVATVGGDGTGSGDYGRYAVAGDSGYVTYNGTVIAGSYVGGNYSSTGYKTGSDWGAGGGGGASQRGVDGRVYNVNAYGGNGIASDITGTTKYYAGGGNGSSSCGYLASNGYGGGTAGGYQQAGGAGVDNTGGGGGAGCAAAGGNGGSGIVIIRGRFTAVAY